MIGFLPINNRIERCKANAEIACAACSLAACLHGKYCAGRSAFPCQYLGLSISLSSCKGWGHLWSVLLHFWDNMEREQIKKIMFFV
jgi:hypothetical protein